MFFEVVENADMKPDEGLRAAGGNWVERVRFGMVPQVLPNFLSYTLLRLEINVRASTIIGAVGGGGIGEALRLSISRGHEAKTIAIILLLLTTVIAVDQFSGLAQAAGGWRTGLYQRPGSRVMSAMTATELTDIIGRHPAVFNRPFLSRHGKSVGVAAVTIYLVFAWNLFAVGQVFQRGNWDIAGSYLADWVSYEVRPDVEYRDGYLEVDFPRFSPLGADPKPDWLSERNGGSHNRI
jgi:hypothetical protein